MSFCALPRLRANDSTLTGLHLGDNEIGDAGAKELANGLKVNSTLSYLDLWNNSIGDEGAKALANALKVNSTLSKLYLTGNKIGAEGTKAFANALRDRRTSAVLHLRNNFGDWSVRLIANALKYNSTLTELSLSDNIISDELYRQMIDVLTRNMNESRKKMQK